MGALGALIEELGQVQAGPRGIELVHLPGAGETVGEYGGVAVGGAQRGGERVLRDLHAHVVVLRLEAEVARHAAAAIGVDDVAYAGRCEHRALGGGAEDRVLVAVCLSTT